MRQFVDCAAAKDIAHVGDAFIMFDGNLYFFCHSFPHRSHGSKFVNIYTVFRSCQNEPGCKDREPAIQKDQMAVKGVSRMQINNPTSESRMSSRRFANS